MATNEFHQKTADLDVMTRHRKTEIADAMRVGVEIPLGELAALANLEIRIEARQAFARVSALTREVEEEEEE